MPQHPINDGQLLKKWVALSGKPVNDIVKGMGFSNYSHLHYYYPQEQIKKSTVEKFCEVLGISIEDFYNGELVKGNSSGTSISMHHGQNLKNAVKNAPMTNTAFASKMDISRQTLDLWYKKPQLDDGDIKRAAKILKVQPALIKGIDVHEYTVNDLYYMLKGINEKLDRVNAKLDKKAL